MNKVIIMVVLMFFIACHNKLNENKFNTYEEYKRDFIKNIFDKKNEEYLSDYQQYIKFKNPIFSNGLDLRIRHLTKANIQIEIINNSAEIKYIDTLLLPEIVGISFFILDVKTKKLVNWIGPQVLFEVNELYPLQQNETIKEQFNLRKIDSGVEICKYNLKPGKKYKIFATYNSDNFEGWKNAWSGRLVSNEVLFKYNK